MPRAAEHRLAQSDALNVPAMLVVQAQVLARLRSFSAELQRLEFRCELIEVTLELTPDVQAAYIAYDQLTFMSG